MSSSLEAAVSSSRLQWAANWSCLAQPAPLDGALLRFMAGVRALLAVLVGAALLTLGSVHGLLTVIVVAYLSWAAILMWKTLAQAPWTASRAWPWIDAAFLLSVSWFTAFQLPPIAAIAVLPVVALTLMGAMAHAIALAAVCGAAVMLIFGTSPLLATRLVEPTVGLPIMLLAFGPAAALLARPNRLVREHAQLLDAFSAAADPRQGLHHHVHVLLSLLGARFRLSACTLSLRGLQPQVFRWQAGGRTVPLPVPEAGVWRQRLSALPQDSGCLFTSDRQSRVQVQALDLRTGARRAASDDARQALLAMGAQTLALPLVSYGRPQGHLCLRRTDQPFTADDLRWLQALMREALPLLERSDLLEQLQLETASRERERIGRDLHDSAVQPYLGLKYGLEALARRAGEHNPVTPHITQLVALATEELQTLRDVVNGLRSGQDPTCGSSALAALGRQAERFEALYGLKVNVFAEQAQHLSGSTAKSVLHMVNEALTNVRRHTSATAVTVLLDMDDDKLQLRIRNDHGPDEALPAEFLPRSLSERAEELGGRVAVAHESNFTEIGITLPPTGAIG